MKRIYWAAGSVAILAISAGVLLTLIPNGDPTEERAEVDRFLRESVAVMSPFPPIRSIPMSRASQADTVLAADELVIGVAKGGAARAYPLNMVNTPERKVINDQLGSEPILVCWCDRCHTAAVFSRRINGTVYVFGCSGLLWRDTLVMYDEQTESFWNHVMGECVAGSLSGTRLEPIEAVITNWKDWQKAYPETTVLNAEKVSEFLDTEYYEHPRDEIAFAVRDEQVQIAWGYDFLSGHPVYNTQVGDEAAVVFFESDDFTAQAFSRILAGKALTFEPAGDRVVDSQTRSLWDPLTGRALEGPLAGKHLKPIPGITVYEHAWRSFYPDGEFVGDSDASL